MVSVQDRVTSLYASSDKSGNLGVKVLSGVGLDKQACVGIFVVWEMLTKIFFISQDIDIMVTYSDASGAIRVGSVQAKDLSSSWVWCTSDSHFEDHVKVTEVLVLKIEI